MISSQNEQGCVICHRAGVGVLWAAQYVKQSRVVGCIDGKRDGDFNRCLLATYYEKSSFNINPIAMTTCL